MIDPGPGFPPRLDDGASGGSFPSSESADGWLPLSQGDCLIKRGSDAVNAMIYSSGLHVKAISCRSHDDAHDHTPPAVQD